MADNILVRTIIEGIQEKKGKNIIVVDLSKFDSSACSYFVICEGDSNTHVSSITESIKDYVRKNAQTKPVAIDGLENSLWVALDYLEVIVHVFQREPREFYDIEHLWEDATIEKIPDIA